MKNKRKTSLTLAAAVCLLAAVPVQASAVSQNFSAIPWDEMESPSYIIDFLDYDGNLLDSRICMYGEKMENIVVPEREEDEQYIYQFAGWEPQLSETVTDCASYIAVYRKKEKSDTAGDDNDFQIEMPEESDPSPKVLSNGSRPEEVQQVSAISYDVISFHIETPAAEPVPAPDVENTASSNELPAVTGTDTRSEPAPIKKKTPEAMETILPDKEETTRQPQPLLPAVSDSSDQIPEPAEAPVHMDMDTADAPDNRRKPDTADIPMKKNTPRPLPAKNISSKTMKQTAGLQEIPKISTCNPSTPVPVPETSGQISKAVFPVPFLTGILAGGVLCIFCLLKKQRRF